MRLLSISICLCVISTRALLAQPEFLETGVFEYGGSVSYADQKGDIYGDGNDSHKRLSLFPSALYFVSPQLAIGAKVHYEWSSNGEASGTAILGVGPIANWYFTMNESGAPFLSLGLTHDNYSVKYPDDFGTRNQSGDGQTANLGIGYVITLNSFVGISGEGYYSIHNHEEDNGSEVGIRFGFKVFHAPYGL